MEYEDALRAALTLATVGAFLWLTATSQIQGQILGVVLLALVLWSLYPDRHLESSVIVVAALSLFQASLSVEEFISSIFSTYGGSGLWIIVAGFVLAKAMERSGLARRIALWIATSLGGNPGGIVLSVAVANLAVAPLSPSTTAKAFLLLPICTALVEAFGVEKGSRFGASVMLMAMAANNICSTAFLTATVPNPISAGYIGEALGLTLDWLGWLRMALPMTVVLLLLAWFVCMRMFTPDVDGTGESIARIRGLREGLGPFRRGEKIVAMFFSACLLLWITDGLHPFNGGLVSLFLALILFIPGLGVMDVGGFAGDVPWGSIAVFAASMFLARAVGRWDALDPVAETVFGFMRLSRLPPAMFSVLLVFVFMFLHVVFTSTTVYATVMMPLVISLGQLQGGGTGFLALAVAFLAPIAVILPVNTIPNIVFLSSGYFSQKQIFSYGLVLSAVSSVLVLVLGYPYWSVIGLI